MKVLSGVVSRSIIKTHVWAVGVLLAALVSSAVQAPAQQSSSGGQSGTSKTFSLSATVDTYSDAASTSCEKGNTSPYAGMDPLACYGVMAPTDSAGQCSLSGMSVFKKVGGTCYYCQPIVPPTPGILVPLDDIAAAGRQGYRCGVDQADPNCMAVCTRESGSGPFVPPPGTTLESGPGPGGPLPGPGPGPTTPPPPTSRPGPPLSGSVTSGNPCLPFGPGGYDYCANPPGTQPAGCVCSKAGNKPGTPPSNPLINTAQYIQGMAAGVAGCVKGFGDLLAGAGFFAQGDFVHAAQSWGLSPGQSVTLKAIYSELTTPVVGSNVTPYQQGVTAGRRICSYAVAPAVAKGVLKGTAGARANPASGSTLLDATTENPASLANKWVQPATGPPVQLGNYIGKGTFASVYQFGKNSVMKLSTNQDGSLEALAGQEAGAARLKAIGIETPNISDYKPGGPNQAGSLVADDVTQKWPGAYQLTGEQFNALPAAQRAQVTTAFNNTMNKLADAGLVWPDNHFRNMVFQPMGDALNVIIHDPDMIMTVPEVQEAIAQGTMPAKVLMSVLDSVGQMNLLNQPFTAQSLMNALRNARIGGGWGGSTVIPP